MTDPSGVTVAVKEVSNTFKVTVKDSLQERIDNELEIIWDGNIINEFRVEPDINNFSGEVSCRGFTNDLLPFWQPVCWNPFPSVIGQQHTWQRIHSSSNKVAFSPFKGCFCSPLCIIVSSILI